jgi:V8-like Glu-specific endopeptidase
MAVRQFMRQSRNAAIGVPVLCYFLLVFSSGARAQQPITLGDILNCDLEVSVQPGQQSSDWSLIKRIDSSLLSELSGTNFIQIHFSEIQGSNAQDYTVTIFNSGHQILQSFGKDSFALRNSFWSKPIPGDVVQIEVTAAAPPIGLKFKVKEVAFAHREIVKYSIVHNPSDLEEIRAYAGVPPIQKASSPVGRLTFFANGHLEACSGFLVDDSRFLTNHHCIDSADVCVAGARVDFGYEETPNGHLSAGTAYDCIQLVDKAPDLDASLIKLAGKPGLKWGHLELSSRAVAQDEQAYLIQHPGGDPKQIARKECYISTLSAEWEAPDIDIGHMCDTAKGSSGSPLIGKDFKVVGLHHRGFDDDGRWKAENRAVKIGRIMERMRLSEQKE